MLSSHVVRARLWAFLLATGIAAAATGCNDSGSTSTTPYAAAAPAPASDPTTTTTTPTAPAAPLPTQIAGAPCANQVVFNRDLLPLINSQCLTCHATFGDYATAVTVAAAMATRVTLAAADPDRMPLAPLAALDASDQQAFTQWPADGLIQDVTDPVCTSGTTGSPTPSPTPSPTIDVSSLNLTYVESAVLTDLASQTSAIAQQNVRYLVLTHKVIEGATPAAMANFKWAINKGINGLSTAAGLFKAVPIDANNTIYRFDLRDENMTPAEWTLIENAEPLNFESFTTLGLQIKTLSATRKAWLHAENFLFTSHGGVDQSIYYNILGIPTDLTQFQTGIGVNFAGAQQNDFQAHFIGFNGSPIAENKNRLLTRVPSRDGYYWQTFDIDTTPLSTKNLFQFPLLAASGGQAIYTPDASEIIYSLPNQMQAYALFTAAGSRLDVAALDVVRDNLTPFDPTIINAISCSRCHNQGMITATDQVGADILQNGSQFVANDVSLVGALYRSAAENTATFTTDTTTFSNTLAALNIPAASADPISYAMDTLRADQTLTSLSSLLFMTPSQFTTALNSSAVGRAAFGQLLTGGTVDFSQLTQTLPQFLIDIGFGQNLLVGSDPTTPVSLFNPPVSPVAPAPATPVQTTDALSILKL
jgi:hypothetical protein